MDVGTRSRLQVRKNFEELQTLQCEILKILIVLSSNKNQKLLQTVPDKDKKRHGNVNSYDTPKVFY